MICPERLFREGYCFYIKSGSYRKKILFSSDKDYEKYLDIICNYKLRFNGKIYGFCLLPDEVYLILKFNQIDKATSFMKQVNHTYAYYRNFENKTNGKLWQGKIENGIIDKLINLTNCIKHIEMIPVYKNYTNSPVEYPWSSCGYRVLGDEVGILDRIHVEKMIDS